jgi:hydroxymethylbilane synthase
VVEPLRGNVDTRLRKLDAGDWDAVVLAAAGLRRLGVTPAHAAPLDPVEFVPAVGQGIVAVEARAGDRPTLTALARADDGATRACALAERAYLARLGASCHTPMAAHARLAGGGTLTMSAVVASEDGRRVLRAAGSAPAADGARLGVQLAESLLAQGAAEVTALKPVA